MYRLALSDFVWNLYFPQSSKWINFFIGSARWVSAWICFLWDIFIWKFWNLTQGLWRVFSIKSLCLDLMRAYRIEFAFAIWRMIIPTFCYEWTDLWSDCTYLIWLFRKSCGWIRWILNPALMLAVAQPLNLAVWWSKSHLWCSCQVYSWVTKLCSLVFIFSSATPLQ